MNEPAPPPPSTSPLRPSGSLLVVTPTYNERENIARLIPAVLSHLPDAQILVVDDNSPDGTGALAEEMAATEGKGRIHVLHRAGKEGLGRAYVAGMTWGIERGYEYILQMDADLSHDPVYLPAIAAAVQNADIVIGSRYVPGGGTKNWGVHRQILSRFANFYVRTILGQSVKDMTGGYRCWRRETLQSVDLPTIRSNGYAFIVETLYRALKANPRVRVAEVPIVFVDRVFGQSKMSVGVMFESMVMVWRLRFGKPAAQSSPRAAA